MKVPNKAFLAKVLAKEVSYYVGYSMKKGSRTTYRGGMQSIAAHRAAGYITCRPGGFMGTTYYELTEKGRAALEPTND